MVWTSSISILLTVFFWITYDWVSSSIWLKWFLVISLCEELQNRDYGRLISKCKCIFISKVIGKSALRIFKYNFIFSLIHDTQVKIRLTAVIVSKAIRAECRQTRLIKLWKFTHTLIISTSWTIKNLLLLISFYNTFEVFRSRSGLR